MLPGRQLWELVVWFEPVDGGRGMEDAFAIYRAELVHHRVIDSIGLYLADHGWQNDIEGTTPNSIVWYIILIGGLVFCDLPVMLAGAFTS